MPSDTVFKSACRMCHGGCGVLVHVKSGKVVKIEGNPDSPASQGKICPKGLASIEHLYHPDRITHPLKRIGERGEGKWKRITWEEAYQILVEKIEILQCRYGPETVAVGHGTGRYHFSHVLRFAHAIGTPNWVEPGTAQCFIPRIIASGVTYGDLIVSDYGYNGVTHPKCLLCWGKHPYISGPDAESQFRVKNCLKQGPKLIVIDPRETQMAKMADIWLKVRPGTDAALALAFSHVIIEEKLYDREFIENRTVGFEALKERVQQYTPEKAAEICWVPAEQIRAAARLYAGTKPAAMTWGNALEHNTNAFQNARAVGILPALTGNIDIPVETSSESTHLTKSICCLVTFPMIPRINVWAHPPIACCAADIRRCNRQISIPYSRPCGPVSLTPSKPFSFSATTAWYPSQIPGRPMRPSNASIFSP